MIIECEKCKAKFNLDDSLLKNRGTKVQCSICNDIFIAYLQKPTLAGEAAPAQASEEGIRDTMSSNADLASAKKEPDFVDETAQADFDTAFEEAVGEDTMEASLAEDDSEEDFKIELALDREVKEGFEVTKERIENKKDDRPIPAEAGRSKGKTGPSSPFLIILLVILILLGGTAAVYFIAPQFISNSLTLFKFKNDKGQETDVAGTSKLSFKGVTGSFVQSAKAGQFFVIKGMVANDYSKSRSFVLIKGTILDDREQVVKSKMAYAGNTFSGKQIKAMTLEQINAGLKIDPVKVISM